jgi:hypothetical protein
MGDGGIASVVTFNVACFSVEAARLPSQIQRLDIDGCTLSIPGNDPADDPRLHYFQRDDSGRWGVSVVSGLLSLSSLSYQVTHHHAVQILAAAAESPPEPQRSTSPYSILRSPGRLKIVVSGGVLSDCAMSIARRLANDLFTYFKLDADIVHEMEILEAQCEDAHARAGTGNIVVIGSPSGQYIRRCLAKGMTAFTIVESESSPPVLQLKGETLSGLSQGN